MSKKDRNHKMSFKCPKCGERMETRNMKPKCFNPDCGIPLEIIETNPEVVVRIRERKKKKR